MPIYNALKHIKFESININKILTCFDSGSMQTQFQDIQNLFLDLLRPKTNNYYIEFEYKITDNKNTNFIITKEDIFKKMIEKNPLILNLKENLGLII